MHEKDVELLALWLHGTAHAAGQAGTVRDLIRTASVQAIEMYGLPGEGEEDDREDMPTLMGRFAAKWDECERHTREHLEGVTTEAPGGVSETGSAQTRPTGETDRWGYGVGTQAARINELLAGNGFRTTDEVFEVLVREFPTTTRGRVSSHIQSLRHYHPSRLQEQRDGRRVAFRLD
jgi:hypothetical protein